MAKLLDLTGEEFGRLTVVRRGEDYIRRNGGKCVRWLCICSCGNPNLILVSASNLRSGKTRSCGCIKDERMRAGKKENVYEPCGEYTIGYTSKGETFIIDTEDLEKVKPYCWCVTRLGYIVARNPADGGSIRLHKLITGTQANEIVDHINHNVADNRKCNLRIVSHSNNMINSVIRSSNTSGVTGVTYHKPSDGWISRISMDGKCYYLGYYKSFSDAVAARKAAEEKYFGPYSYDNSIAAVPRIDTSTSLSMRAAG